MSKTELLALADALWFPDVDDDTPASLNDDTMRQASAALREYAALLDQEPVAWIGPYKSAWDALNELRKSCAEIIGADPETWPNHGNAPLAIAATLAIARTHMEQGTHPPAPSVPLTFIQERAQLDQEWSVLDAMKAAYKPTTPQSASVFGGSYQADGYIVSRFTTTAGAERVVFEFNEPKGMLHIFTPEQIEVKP